MPGGQADFARREIQFADGQRVELSERESELLRYLVANRGRAIAREELLDSVWRINPQGVTTRTIDMHIARLREKLRDDSDDPRVLLTVRGTGYMFAAEADAAADSECRPPGGRLSIDEAPLMRRPWQIWTLFGLCLAMVVPAMLWLTHRTLQLDRADAQAQQQAELEEAVSSALWQLDAELTQLIAPEIARPAIFFQPFYALPGKGRPSPVPSPLLGQPSPYVLLHFQLEPDGRWSSPQCPHGAQYRLALASGVAAENIQDSAARLQELSGGVEYAGPVGPLAQPDAGDRTRGTGTLGQQPGLPEPAQTSRGAQGSPGRTARCNNNWKSPRATLRRPRRSQSEPQLAQQANTYNQKRQQLAQSRRGNELQNRNAVLQTAAEQSAAGSADQLRPAPGRNRDRRRRQPAAVDRFAPGAGAARADRATGP